MRCPIFSRDREKNMILKQLCENKKDIKWCCAGVQDISDVVAHLHYCLFSTSWSNPSLLMALEKVRHSWKQLTKQQRLQSSQEMSRWKVAETKRVVPERRLPLLLFALLDLGPSAACRNSFGAELRESFILKSILFAVNGIMGWATTT